MIFCNTITKEFPNFLIEILVTVNDLLFSQKYINDVQNEPLYKYYRLRNRRHLPATNFFKNVHQVILIPTQHHLPLNF